MLQVIVLVLALLPSLARAEVRIALVITNQAYTQPGAQLSNTYRDGEIVKAALEKVGFKVWVVKDTASEGALLQAIGEHVQRLAEAGPDAVGFLYYSGHGAADRPDGANYLIPTAAPLTHASQLALMAVRLDRVTQTLANTGKMSFVVFDACRNVPLQRETKDLAFKGFAPVREQNGLLVAFATEPGNVAVDQSVYAKALAEMLVRPGLEAGQVFRQVRLRVRTATREKQSPEYLDKRERDFSFMDIPAAVVPAASPSTTLHALPERLWTLIRDTKDQSVLENFIKEFGDTSYGSLARDRIDALKRAERPKAAGPEPRAKGRAERPTAAEPEVRANSEADSRQGEQDRLFQQFLQWANSQKRPKVDQTVAVPEARAKSEEDARQEEQDRLFQQFLQWSKTQKR